MNDPGRADGPRLTRRRLLAAGGTAAAGLGALGISGCFGDDEPVARPKRRRADRNVLLIVVDSLRNDYIGAFAGSATGGRAVRGPAVRTPNIDALVRESLRFDLSVPETMPTGPARRTIFMARRQFPFRDWKAQSQLPQVPGWMGIVEDDPTWVKWARDAGVTTALSADTPFVIAPRFAGLQKHFTHVNRAFGEPPIMGLPGRLVGDDVLAKYLSPVMAGAPEAERLREFVTNVRPGGPAATHPSAKSFNGARRLLRRLRRTQPFALVVDTFGPHEPWAPPAEYIRLYDDLVFDGIEPIQPFRSPYGQIADLDERTVQRARVLYAAEISFADALIGQLLNELADLGLADRTTVLLTSDHGVSMGEGGIIGKDGDNPFSELHHVPFILRDPAGRRAGATSPYLASTHDIGPTVLSAVGVDSFEGADGEDLTSLFAGKAPPPRPVFTAGYGDHILAGDHDWLLLADNQGREKRLYSRSNETENVAASRPKEVERLWEATVDAAGGPLPTFGPDGAKPS